MDFVLDLKPKAKQRGMQYLFSFVKTEQVLVGEVTTFKSVFYLHAGKGMVPTCKSFWRNTFGLGMHTVKQLVKLSRTELCVSLTIHMSKHNVSLSRFFCRAVWCLF